MGLEKDSKRIINRPIKSMCQHNYQNNIQCRIDIYMIRDGFICNTDIQQIDTQYTNRYKRTHTHTHAIIIPKKKRKTKREQQIDLVANNHIK